MKTRLCISQLPPIALLGALLALTAGAYWPGLNGGFIFDDYPNIVNNTALHVNNLTWSTWIAAVFSSPASALQRPLAMLSFAINHYFNGLDPWSMKLTNLGIHLVNTTLVFGLVRCVFRAIQSTAPSNQKTKDSAALFAAACWALHPINVMAVLFIVQRMESLSHTFVFAGLWLYVLGRLRQIQGSNGWHLIFIGLVPCTLLGLLAKESAVLLPLYAFCLELCILDYRGKQNRRDSRLYVLFACLLALPAVLGLMWLLPMALDPTSFATRDFTLIERLLTEGRVVLDYLHWTLLPNLSQLSLYHDDYLISRNLWSPPSTILGFIVIPALLIAAWFLRRHRPLTSLGIVWFFAGQLLTATILPLELVFEHRNYFASLGICLALTDVLLIPKNHLTPRIGAVLAVSFLLLCFAITHLRAREWSDPIRFASTEAAKHPQSPRATYELARTLITLTAFNTNSPLIDNTWSALANARQAPNSKMLAIQASLSFAARTGAPINQDWWYQLQTKLRQNPLSSEGLAVLGAMTDCALEHHCPFPTQDMLATFNAALTQGRHPEALHIYGNYALNVLHDTNLALALWQEAYTLNPNEPQYSISLAKLMIALARYDEARLYIAQLRKLGRLGQYEAAAESLEARLKSTINSANQSHAVKINPSIP